MSSLRPAKLRGAWYPGDNEACDAFFQDVTSLSQDLPEAAFGAIVPHAGWTYSGAVAYEALEALEQRRSGTDLVVLFGGHLGSRHSPRTLIEGAWETPYGPMEVAEELAAALTMGIGAEPETPSDFHDDNAIEVVMPMVKKLWPEAKVVTIGIPPTDEATGMGREVVDLAKQNGFKTISIVGSTDLTHYGPNYSYNPAGRGMKGLEWVKTKNDAEIIEQMEALDGGKVVWLAERSRSACGAGAVAAAIGATKKLGAKKGIVTRYTTSWDVKPLEPEPASFVGYVGMLFA